MNGLENFQDEVLLNEKKNGGKFLYSKGENKIREEDERKKEKGLGKVSTRIKCFKVLSFQVRNLEIWKTV